MRSGTPVDPAYASRAKGNSHEATEYVHEEHGEPTKPDVVKCAVYMFQFHVIKG